MSYENIVQKLQKDEVVLLDGGTGTELQKRGLDMVPGAWCGPVSLKNADVLEKVHLDYIEAGADIITANTYASSRIMLREAGYCLLYTSPSPRDVEEARMPSSA